MSSSTIGCPTEEREVLDVAGTALSGEAIALHPGSPVEQVAADDGLIAVDVVVKQVPVTFREWLHGPGNADVLKLVVDRDAGVLVGATAIGAEAGETLHAGAEEDAPGGVELR